MNDRRADVHACLVAMERHEALRKTLETDVFDKITYLADRVGVRRRSGETNQALIERVRESEGEVFPPEEPITKVEALRVKK